MLLWKARGGSWLGDMKYEYMLSSSMLWRNPPGRVQPSELLRQLVEGHALGQDQVDAGLPREVLHHLPDIID